MINLRGKATGSGTGNLSLAYPAGITKGDLICVFVTRHHAETLTVPTGYALNTFVFTGTVHLDLLTKTADGTESGTLTITITGTTQNGGWMGVYKSNRGLVLTIANYVTASSANSITNVQPVSTAGFTTMWIAAGAVYSSTVASSTFSISTLGWRSQDSQASDTAGDHMRLDVVTHDAYADQANDPVFNWTQTYTNLASILIGFSENAATQVDPSALIDPWRSASWDQPTAFTAQQMLQLRSNVLNAAISSILNSDGQAIFSPGIGWNFKGNGFHNGTQDTLPGIAPLYARMYWWYGRTNFAGAQFGDGSQNKWIMAIPTYYQSNLYGLRLFHSRDNERTYVPFMDEFGRNQLFISYRFINNQITNYVFETTWSVGDYGI